jgi:hypothetical protein
MAKVLSPLHSSEARGRCGGLVYNTWRGIRTVKTHTDPDHEDDPKRVAHKLIVQAAGARWRDLTGEQRAAWTAFADLHLEVDWTGTPKRLAGYHWYVRIQTKLKDLGLAYIDTPPTDQVLCSITDLHISTALGDAYLNWTVLGDYDVDNTKIDIWSVGPHSPGRSPTLHEATHYIYDALVYGWTYIGGNPGDWYTIFARPIVTSGLTGQWASVKQEIPA